MRLEVSINKEDVYKAIGGDTEALQRITEAAEKQIQQSMLEHVLEDMLDVIMAAYNGFCALEAAERQLMREDVTKARETMADRIDDLGYKEERRSQWGTLLLEALKEQEGNNNG